MPGHMFLHAISKLTKAVEKGNRSGDGGGNGGGGNSRNNNKHTCEHCGKDGHRDYDSDGEIRVAT